MAVADTRTCAKCGVQPAGDGGVLCLTCRQALEEQMADYWQADAPVQPDSATQEISPE